MSYNLGLGLSTAGTGASVGSAFGPVGAAAGAIVGLAGGLLGGDTPQVTTPPPSAVDVNQLAFLDELKRTREATTAGLSTEYQLARQLISESEAQSLSSAVMSAGGDVGGVVAAMDRISKNASENVSKVVGTASTQAMAYTQLIDKLQQNISQRALDVNTTIWASQMGAQADFRSINNQNLYNMMSSPAWSTLSTNLAKYYGLGTDTSAAAAASAKANKK